MCSTHWLLLAALAADWAGTSVVIDREPGQYFGHPTTALLEDGKTVLAVYPKGHGKGAIILKRSTDRGRTWSPRLPVPDNWSTSLETPTIHRISKKRVLLFSGLYPIRMASSDDEGKTWTPLAPIGDYGGIVAMGDVIRRKDGTLLAFFHDDGRYLRNTGKAGQFYVYQVRSKDEGRTWSQPEVIATRPDVDLCEPGVVRSPDGNEVALLLRENRRRMHSFVIFSRNDGDTWSLPQEVSNEMTGDRHRLAYFKDGRLLAVFRDTSFDSAMRGDFVAWVGHYEDLHNAGRGEMRVRLLDNKNAWDCGYAGLERFPDGSFLTVTYGHWDEGQPPYILGVLLPASTAQWPVHP